MSDNEDKTTSSDGGAKEKKVDGDSNNNNEGLANSSENSSENGFENTFENRSEDKAEIKFDTNNNNEYAWTEGQEIKQSDIDNKPKDDNWQRDVISKLASTALDEQRKARRWGILFKSLTFVYLGVLLVIFSNNWEGDAGTSNGTKGEKHAALIELKGVISDDSAANAATVIKGLKAAFKDKNTSGVILEINSPGGSPVQSGYINDEMVRLRKKYPDIPIYVVITDICASGGYYIAAAADKIYADKASLVGSIGVLMDSFGFVEAMNKLGIERRLMTAGEHKGFLDPFSATKPDDVKHVKKMLANIHQQFIDTVKRGRGDRLKDNPDLFSGLVWTGEQGIKLGLVDELGDTSYVAREVIGVDSIVDFTQHPNFVNRLVDRLGVSMGKALSSQFGIGQIR